MDRANYLHRTFIVGTLKYEDFDHKRGGNGSQKLTILYTEYNKTSEIAIKTGEKSQKPFGWYQDSSSGEKKVHRK